ncbi:MAG: MATE family efflux transporter [Oscillospiraceae bacterium]
MEQTKGVALANNKTFYRTVLGLVVPMALHNLINVAVQSGDVIMLGMVGEKVLSAASLAGQVQYVMMLLFFGLSSGAMVLASQYWGKGDVRTIEKILGIALRLSFSAALVFFAAAMLVPGALMRIFTTDAEIVEYGIVYLRLVAPGYLFTAFTNNYLNIIRSVEKVIFSTVVYFLSLGIDLILNAIFIFGLFGFPALGIAGAAASTSVTRGIELVLVLVYALRNPVLRLRAKDIFSREKQLTKDFFHYATPTIVNEFLWGLGMAANAVIIGRMGAAAVAANSVAQVVRQLATVVCFGMANATAIMVGKAIGSGNEQLAKQYAARLIRLTVLTGLAGAAVIFSIRPLVINLMNFSAQANEYLTFLLVCMSVYVVAQAYNATMVVGIFRGGGDTRFGLFVDVSTMWGGSILWAALAAFVFRLPVKWVLAIILLDEFLKIPLTTLRYKSRRWLRNVTR